MNNETNKKQNTDKLEIDLFKLWKIAVEKKKIIAGVIASCTVAAFAAANVMPKEYTASTVLQADDAKNITNYIEYIKNPQVVGATIEQVYENEQTRPDVGTFTKKNLDIVNTKGTQMIQINAKGRSPEEAKQTADRIVENFMAFAVNMDNEDAEKKLDGLEPFISEAKKEADKAGQDLESYRAQNGISTPVNQSIALLGNNGESWIIAEGNKEYQEYLRNFIIKQNIYNKYANQIEILKMTQKSSVVDIKKVSDAVIPSQPSGPKIRMITAVGLVLGGMLSLVYSIYLYKKKY